MKKKFNRVFHQEKSVDNILSPEIRITGERNKSGSFEKSQ